MVRDGGLRDMRSVLGAMDMSNYEMKNGRGSLFKAPPGKKHDLSGSIKTPDGKELKLVGYVATDRETGKPRKDKHGNTWINLQVFEDDGQRPAPERSSFERDEKDDEIPFN